MMRRRTGVSFGNGGDCAKLCGCCEILKML